MSSNTLALTSIKGTPLYMAPELVKEQPYTSSIDLWSLGVILYELFVGEPPFFTNNLMSLIEKIMNDKIKYPDTMSPGFKDFLEGLLEKNPQKRLNWPELLHHPFIQEDEEEKAVSRRSQEKYDQWIALNFYNTVGNAPTEEFQNFGNNKGAGPNAVSKQSDPLLFEDYEETFVDEPNTGVWKVWIQDAKKKENGNSLRKNTKLLDNFLKVFGQNPIEITSSDKKIETFMNAIKVLCLVATNSDDDFKSQIDILKNREIPRLLISKIKVFAKDKEPNSKSYELTSYILMAVALVSKEFYTPTDGLEKIFFEGRNNEN